MLRLLQAIRSRRNRRELEQAGTLSPEPQRLTSDPRISSEMAFKLFGEPEPMPTPLVVPELVQAAEPMSSPDARFRAELTPPPKPDPFEEVRRAAEEELRFRAVLEATTGPMRRELAQAVPELGSPVPYLSELENEVLRLVYVKGMPFTAVAQRHKLSTAKAKRMARVALCYVAFYAKRPERAGERVERCFNPGVQQFVMAGCLEEKRFTVKRHPELRVLLEKLLEREAEALYAVYWDDLTLAEAGERMGVTRERVRQLANKGIRKLRYLDSRKLRWREGEAKREHLIRVLQQLPTLAEAAGALEITPKELLVCLNRMGVVPSVASPSRVVEDHPGVDALKGAKSPIARMRVAASYPELRPPHMFLDADENKVLEGLYWQGMSYKEAARELGWVSTAQVKRIEASALERLAYYLRHQPLSYYQGVQPDAPTIL